MRFQLCSPYFCTAINQGPHPPASPAGPRRSSRWRSNRRSHARSLVFHGDLPRKKTQKLGFIAAKWWIWWISFVNPGILSRLIWIKKIGNGGIPKKYGNIGDEWDFLTIKSFHPIHGQEIIRKMICMICLPLPVDGMGYPIFRQTEMEATWRGTLLTMELDLGWK